MNVPNDGSKKIEEALIKLGLILDSDSLHKEQQLRSLLTDLYRAGYVEGSSWD